MSSPRPRRPAAPRRSRAWIAASLTIVVAAGLAAAASRWWPASSSVSSARGEAATAAPRAAPVADASPRGHGEHMDVELVAATTSLAPGVEAAAGVRFTTEAHWHFYWQNFGDSGKTPVLKWALPPGFSAGPIEWPAPSRFATGPLSVFGYTGDVVLPVRLSVPAGFSGDAATLVADVQWLVCEDECVPGSARLSLTLPVRPATPALDPRTAPLFEAARRLRPGPLPSGAAAAAKAIPDAVRLSLAGDGPWRDAAARLTWFTGEGNLFKAGAKYEPTREGDAVSVDVPIERPSAVRRAPPRLVGVLDVDRAGQRSAYAIDVAVEGALPADPVPAAGGPGGERAPVVATISPAPDADAPTSLWRALLLAFVGGLILNVMPCVLPILSVKILGFVQQAGENPRRVRLHGGAFGAGVLVSFWALAGLLLALREAGKGFGWGFQFQNPLFTGALCLVMFAAGLNLLGVFEFGHAIAGAAGTAAHRAGHSTYLGSFSNGVLATIVATPCTAPFMSVAIPFALAASTTEALAVFTALGAGMAAPFVLLSIFPAWLRRLPRPGAWMETFKHAMAFPMFAVIVWLGPTFGKQTGANGLVWLMAALLAFGLAAWLFGRFGTPSAGPRVRAVVGRGLAAVVVLGSVGLLAYAAQRDPGADAAPPEGWVAWRPGIEDEFLAQGRVVFVDFTADWCATCKVNDQLFLSTDAVADAAKRLGVVRVQADWTRSSQDISDALHAVGRESVPTYVVWSPDRPRQPEVLPTAITSGTVVDAFERAVKKSGAAGPDAPR